jgi:hypothetical protein
MQQYLLLQRNLVYTGITRGKKLVILIGQRKALGMAVWIIYGHGTPNLDFLYRRSFDASAGFWQRQ